MGQTLKKLAPGTEENKIKEISPIIEECYETHFAETHFAETHFAETHFADTTKEPSLTQFYRAVCETVEEINKRVGNTQFCVPKESKLKHAYDEHHQGKGRSLTRDEFQKIFQEVIVGTEFTGGGAKDTLIYIFGVPLTALLIKQRLMPRVIPNEIFIPGITSAAVFVLAKLNKI